MLPAPEALAALAFLTLGNQSADILTAQVGVRMAGYSRGRKERGNRGVLASPRLLVRCDAFRHTSQCLPLLSQGAPVLKVCSGDWWRCESAPFCHLFEIQVRMLSENSWQALADYDGRDHGLTKGQLLRSRGVHQHKFRVVVPP